MPSQTNQIFSHGYDFFIPEHLWDHVEKILPAGLKDSFEVTKLNIPLNQKENLPGVVISALTTTALNDIHEVLVNSSTPIVDVKVPFTDLFADEFSIKDIPTFDVKKRRDELLDRWTKEQDPSKKEKLMQQLNNLRNAKQARKYDSEYMTVEKELKLLLQQAVGRKMTPEELAKQKDLETKLEHLSKTAKAREIFIDEDVVKSKVGDSPKKGDKFPYRNSEAVLAESDEYPIGNPGWWASITFKKESSEGIGYGGDRPGIAVAPKRDEDVSLNPIQLAIASKTWSAKEAGENIYDIFDDNQKKILQIKGGEKFSKEQLEQIVLSELSKRKMSATHIESGKVFKIASFDIAKKQVTAREMYSTTLVDLSLEKIALDLENYPEWIAHDDHNDEVLSITRSGREAFVFCPISGEVTTMAMGESTNQQPLATPEAYPVEGSKKASDDGGDGWEDEEVNEKAWEMFHEHWNALGTKEQDAVYRELGLERREYVDFSQPTRMKADKVTGDPSTFHCDDCLRDYPLSDIGRTLKNKEVICKDCWKARQQEQSEFENPTRMGKKANVPDQEYKGYGIHKFPVQEGVSILNEDGKVIDVARDAAEAMLKIDKILSLHKQTSLNKKAELIREIHKATDQYNYNGTEYNLSNGTLKKDQVIPLSKTHVRLTDPTKSRYERYAGNGEWQLISDVDFAKYKAEWDEINKANYGVKVKTSRRLSKRQNVVQLRREAYLKMKTECPDCYAKFLKFAREKGVNLEIRSSYINPGDKVKLTKNWSRILQEYGMDDHDTEAIYNLVKKYAGDDYDDKIDTLDLTFTVDKYVRNGLEVPSMSDTFGAYADSLIIGGEHYLADLFEKVTVAKKAENTLDEQIQRIRTRINTVKDRIQTSGSKKKADQIPGGLADKKKPEDFDQAQLEKGVKVEMEHTDDPEKAKEIAMDHLTEDAQYYEKLQRMEKSDLHPIEENAVVELVKWIELDLDMIENAYRDRPEVVQHIEDIENEIAELEKKLGVEHVKPIHEMEEKEHKKASLTRYICPDCNKPTVEEGYLGWRECTRPRCGWKEGPQPSTLTEVEVKDHKEAGANYSTDKRFICPECGKPEVTHGYLGWRSCDKCGWEEGPLPETLKEVKESFLKTQLQKKFAAHIQKGDAYVMRLLEDFDYEYEKDIQEILMSGSSVDDRFALIKAKIPELFDRLIDDKQIDVKQVEWSPVQVDDQDIMKLIEDHDDLNKESSIEKENSAYKTPKPTAIPPQGFQYAYDPVSGQWALVALQ